MRNVIKGAFLGAMLLCGSAAVAGPVTLTFEGLADQSTVGDYYNGGAGGNYGINFGSDSLALISLAAGGNGNFSGNPSGDTILFFLSGPGDVMNVAAGFDTGFSFYYAASQAGSVSVYSGLDGTGSLLASLTLDPTPNPYSVWSPVGVSFSGTAQSVIFSGAADFIGFDNITLGASTPGNGGVPEPASWAMMLGGFGLVGGAMRSRRKTAVSFG